MKLLATLRLFLCLALLGPSIATAQQWCDPQCETAEREWTTLLGLSLELDEKSRGSLLDACEVTCNKTLVQLCEILLEDLRESPSSERLRAPKLVFSPQVDIRSVCPNDVPVSGVYAVLRIQVSVSGAVDAVEVEHTPASCPELGPYAESLAKELRYRPSRGPEGYTKSTVFWMVKAEVY